MGEALLEEQLEGRFVFPISVELEEKIRKNGKIQITILPGKEEKPFVYLCGRFLVKSEKGFAEARERQCLCGGGFYLTDEREMVSELEPSGELEALGKLPEYFVWER